MKRGIHKLATWLVLVAYLLTGLAPAQQLVVCLEPDGRIGLEAATPEGCTPCGDPEATSSPEVEGFRVDCCACTDIALPCQSDEPQTRSKDSHGSVAAVAPVYCITAIARIGPGELPGFVPEPRPGPNLASIRTVVLRV